MSQTDTENKEQNAPVTGSTETGNPDPVDNGRSAKGKVRAKPLVELKVEPQLDHNKDLICEFVTLAFGHLVAGPMPDSPIINRAVNPDPTGVTGNPCYVAVDVHKLSDAAGYSMPNLISRAQYSGEALLRIAGGAPDEGGNPSFDFAPRWGNGDRRLVVLVALI